MLIYTRPLFFALLLSACGTVPLGEGQYQVKAGDTLYSIARSTGRSVGEIQRLNQLSDNTIQIGQILNVGPSRANPAPATRPKVPVASPPAPVSKPKAPAIELVWPNKGPVLQGFNGKSNKGINIGGAAGAPIYAAASGKVIYANTVRGYGKLLIIKHDKDYLTAYAHNQHILVKEGDSVKQGQNVAGMGNTGSDKVMLHFELRFKGAAINPSPYLP
ncbi:peptidoglycan DD-metalloendopeptidase family protein [Iodobacter arcticus]|uniref:Peptidoglycan DD-metalloendopeptidase family protein n=1 Tax=Iodobacter arcticus TaxID=590593 RepID=A0ABW2QX93_9NEIS